VNQKSEQERKRVLKIYTIVKKPEAEKGIWLEIGVATENRDGSLSGKLDALPVNGAIHLREHSPRPAEGPRPAGRTHNRPPEPWSYKE